jgi:hypothetical protein
VEVAFFFSVLLLVNFFLTPARDSPYFLLYGKNFSKEEIVTRGLVIAPVVAPMPVLFGATFDCRLALNDMVLRAQFPRNATDSRSTFMSMTGGCRGRPL